MGGLVIIIPFSYNSKTPVTFFRNGRNHEVCSFVRMFYSLQSPQIKQSGALAIISGCLLLVVSRSILPLIWQPLYAPQHSDVATFQTPA